MSVDDRLRDAFRVDDATWEARTSSAYDAVVAGAAQVRRRHLVLAGGGTGAALALVGALVLAGWSPPAVDPSPAPSPPATSASPPGQQLVRGPLAGDWRTAPLTREDVARTLRDAGLGSQADRYVQGLPHGAFRIHLRIYSSYVTTHLGSQDAEHYLLQTMAHRTLIRPPTADDGTTAYWLDVTGSHLVLTVSTTFPPDDRLPAEVAQRALLTSGTFTRE